MAALIKSQERARGKPPRIIPVHSVKRLAPAKKKKKSKLRRRYLDKHILETRKRR